MRRGREHRRHFNPRSPRGGATELIMSDAIKDYNFNPRSPRGGATRISIMTAQAPTNFNPRSPRGGATRGGRRSPLPPIISIHAPHEGERLETCRKVAAAVDFNPRSPRGGATAEKCICIQHFREFAEYYPLRHGDARCIAPQDCIIQAFFGAKKRCFYVRLCFALKNKGVRG